MKTKILLKQVAMLILLLTCFVTTMKAQPYYYYVKQHSSENSTGTITTIYRFNLTSNVVELFHTDSVYVYNLGYDPTQTWIYFWTDVEPNKGPVMLINTAKPNERIALPYIDRVNVYGIFFLPQKQRIYMTTWAKNMVFNSETLAPIDSFAFETHFFIDKYNYPSKDGSLIYFGKKDTATSYYYLEALSTTTNTVVWQKRENDIGYPKEPKVDASGKNGVVLYGYMYPEGAGRKGYYTLYSTSGDSVICNMVDTLNTMPYLSGDAKYLILEETPVNPNGKTMENANFHPGRISVYEAITGQLIQKLKLPPDGKVLVFDNYPNMLYYYLPKQNRSINIDLSQLGPDTCTVKLLSSTGSLLTNGTLQYRDSTWENATNNNDGTFTFTTTRKKVSLRMTYEYGTQTKSNVTVKNDTIIIFQTKDVSVNLQTSNGNPLDTGIVQYNASGWQDFGTTSNGVVMKELLPIKYKFKMTYNNASIEKTQNIDSNATVVFQTVPANVQLQTSTGAPLDTSVVQFNAGGWKNFGTTLNGVVTKELLPTKYNFRMTYNGATISKAQSLDSNATVVFQTVLANVQLQTSTGAPLDTGIVQFNAGGWKTFGMTLNGVVTKELLPTKYNFRMMYNGATVSKAQSIDSNATIVFQTVKTLVQFNNSRGNPIDTGIVQFNSGGWQNFGSTFNGVASKELLPVKYTFRLTYNGSSVSRAQNVDSNATVVFSTVLCTVSVTNTAGSLLNNATVSYNAGGWKVIGTTINGIVTIELLPVKIQFRAAYGSKQQSVTQDVSINPLIAITLPVQ
jgi:hypothetical protein